MLPLFIMEGWLHLETFLLISHHKTSKNKEYFISAALLWDFSFWWWYKINGNAADCPACVLIFLFFSLYCRDSNARSTGDIMTLWCSMRCCCRSSHIVWCQHCHLRGCWEVNLGHSSVWRCCSASMIKMKPMKINTWNNWMSLLLLVSENNSDNLIHSLELWITAVLEIFRGNIV